MNDYIMREDAIALIKGQTEEKPKDDMDIGWNAGLSCAIGQLETIPAADVQPVVRGEWLKELHPNVRYYQYKCSVCGEFSGHDSEGWIWEPNVCPNCGADMRGYSNV